MKLVFRINIVFALAVLALLTLQSTAFALGTGADNKITTSAKDSFIGGGKGNKILTNSIDSVIVGGDTNTIENDAPYSFIGGGYENTASGTNATISGGYKDTASGIGSFIGGGGYGGYTVDGNNNQGNAAAIVGGLGNHIGTNGYAAFIGGGYENIASYGNATVGGGAGNTAGNPDATVGGGFQNTADGFVAVVGGGGNNIASGEYATVPGGADNLASGYFSFAAGEGAQATNYNTFVWSDSTSVFSSTADDQFLIQASGGVGINKNNPSYALDVNGSINASDHVYAGSVELTSDRNAKENFASLNPQAVLDKVAAMPVTEWNYKTDGGIKHIGPMAQDFQAAFGLNGKDDKHISVVDEGGVALAAIQGLNQKLEDENAALKKQNDALAQRLDELEETVNKLAGRN